ncbi:MAG: Flp pilus assembly protein CpaB [Actinobacteria bacterium]|nr:Flp pilus assembly protein CpaB [Actinomycetota bacterium]MBM3711964.1 Flp pilus assembly protein CpaB [Actinomycetota bacterium]
MNRLNLILRRRIFIIIFIIVSVFGGFVIFWYVSSIKEKSSVDLSSLQVFTAKMEINSGTEISDELIELKKIPGNIFNEKFLTNKKDIIGRQAVINISEGEIISVDNIEASQQSESNYLRFSSYIPSYLRAASIPLNFYGDTSMLKIGDIVDVILTYYDKASDGLVAYTVLHKKEIILIKGSSSNNSSEENKKNSGEISLLGNLDDEFYGESNPSLLVVTFYLKPEEVEEVFLSLQKGVLNLSICPKDISTGI